MTLSAMISFNGNCREAIAFYKKVFGVEPKHVMTYGEMPKGPEGPACPGGPLPKELLDRIAYADFPVGGSSIMVSDAMPGMPFVAGNNITLTFGSKDKDEIRRLFGALKEGGTVFMDLQQTFWSELYGMLTDKFGVNWQFSHESGIEF